jgi:hypothetical protein
MKEKLEKFSDAEIKIRFEAALRGARLVGHKPLKDIPKKNGESRLKHGGRRRKALSALRLAVPLVHGARHWKSSQISPKLVLQ